MSNQTNPLLCDLETGSCEIAPASEPLDKNMQVAAKKPLKVIYYTDPICSTCWGIEPQLRKLKLEYGNMLEIDYRMGGLLPDWSYSSGGISKPSDVAHHWDEVSSHYDMPIDGNVWLEDPLPSSYPPSIAFKAAQLQDAHKAVLFLRQLREFLFLQKKNITRWEHISQAAEAAGLDITQLKTDYETVARDLFTEDLAQAKAAGVRGFPTLFFVDGAGNTEKVYGAKPYTVFEAAVCTLQSAAQKQVYQTDWQSLFATYATLTSKEFAELSGMAREEVDTFLQALHEAGSLGKLASKNGPLWRNAQVR